MGGMCPHVSGRGVHCNQLGPAEEKGTQKEERDKTNGGEEKRRKEGGV